MRPEGRRLPSKPDYSGMTVNGRLFNAGLTDDWDAAVRARDRRRMRILQKVSLGRQAVKTADAILADPAFYGF